MLTPGQTILAHLAARRPEWDAAWQIERATGLHRYVINTTLDALEHAALIRSTWIDVTRLGKRECVYSITDAGIKLHHAQGAES